MDPITAEDFLCSFFPSSSAAPSPQLRRSLLVTPAQSGASSLLLQHAFNTARRGRSTLYVHCGPRADLPRERPVRPRLADREDERVEGAFGEDASRDEEEQKLLRLIHIKYVSSLTQLREVLTNLHLPAARPAGVEELPRSLIIDGFSSLLAPRASATPSAAGPSAVAPSPAKRGNAVMQTALGLALAAHATDYLDSLPPPPSCSALAPSLLGPPRPSAPMEGQPRPSEALEPAELLVVCSAPGPEPEVARRWLPTILRIAPLAPLAPLAPPSARAATVERQLFTLRAGRSSLDDDVAAVAYASTRPPLSVPRSATRAAECRRVPVGATECAAAGRRTPTECLPSARRLPPQVCFHSGLSPGAPLRRRQRGATRLPRPLAAPLARPLATRPRRHAARPRELPREGASRPAQPRRECARKAQPVGRHRGASRGRRRALRVDARRSRRRRAPAARRQLRRTVQSSRVRRCVEQR